jgi:hypothetical protein
MTIILEYNLKVKDTKGAFKKLQINYPEYKDLGHLIRNKYSWTIHKKRLHPYGFDSEDINLGLLENIAEFMAPRSFICIIDEEADYHMYEMYFNDKTIEYLFPEWPFERRSKWENLNLQRLLKR